MGDEGEDKESALQLLAEIRFLARTRMESLFIKILGERFLVN